MIDILVDFQKQFTEIQYSGHLKYCEIEKSDFSVNVEDQWHKRHYMEVSFIENLHFVPWLSS